MWRCLFGKKRRLLLHRAAGQEKSRVELIRELLLEGARVKCPGAGESNRSHPHRTPALQTRDHLPVSRTARYRSDLHGFHPRHAPNENRAADRQDENRAKEFGADADTFTADPFDAYGPVTWQSITEAA
jgi:hypothetical protein